MKRIEILYEDDDCLALNKPAGLPVQGGERVTVSLDRLLGGERDSRPLLVHRLDKDTSGIILTAKTREAAARFSRLLSRRLGEEGEGDGSRKWYLALCLGSPEPASGRIAVRLDIRGEPRAAETRYAVLDRLGGEPDFALLELELLTGRTHQIRRHLAHIGHPILGDDKYGDFALNRRLRKTRGLNRLLLHASRLVVQDRGGAFSLDLTAPLPDYFEEFLGSGIRKK